MDGAKNKYDNQSDIYMRITLHLYCFFSSSIVVHKGWHMATMLPLVDFPTFTPICYLPIHFLQIDQIKAQETKICVPYLNLEL